MDALIRIEQAERERDRALDEVCCVHASIQLER